MKANIGAAFIMHNYGKAEYWEQRYAEQEDRTFDWLEDWESLEQILEPLLSSESRVLMLGCGNAEFSKDMYEAGYKHQENIDISTVVIEQMSKRNSLRKEMNWKVMDVRDLKYPDASFDIALDKSTIDALLCGEDAYLNVAKMTKEVQRVLKTGKYYVVISYGAPDSRLEHFHWEHLHWEVSHVMVGQEGDNPHYVYLCRKKEGAEEICAANWERVEEALREDAEALDNEEADNL